MLPRPQKELMVWSLKRSLQYMSRTVHNSETHVEQNMFGMIKAFLPLRKRTGPLN